MQSTCKSFPFVFIPRYQFDGDTAFGVRTEDGDYMLGDGDIYTADQLTSEWNAIFLSYGDLEKVLSEHLSR